MESSSAAADVQTRRDPSAIRITQIGLLIASLGAVLILFHPFGLGAVGIFLAFGGAIIAAPGGIGRSWYIAVTLGVIVAALSRLVADGSETPGGWLAVFGSATILFGAILGFPSTDDE
jgi:hypothetical protein